MAYRGGYRALAGPGYLCCVPGKHPTWEIKSRQPSARPLGLEPQDIRQSSLNLSSLKFTRLVSNHHHLCILQLDCKLQPSLPDVAVSADTEEIIIRSCSRGVHSRCLSFLFLVLRTIFRFDIGLLNNAGNHDQQSSPTRTCLPI